MGDHIRTTRECSLSSLRPALAAAIREHIEQQQLGDLEPSIIGLGPEPAGQQFRDLVRATMAKSQ
jgi:hypothetical protein